VRCILQYALSAEEQVADHNQSLAQIPSLEKAGDHIGRYKLLEQIGEGGCGVVYIAEQEEPIRRRVALKVIKLGMDTKQVIARFEAERQALAIMDHPNIAKVFDAGATDAGRPYFVMELVPGAKITDYCDRHKLSTRQRLDLFIQVCSAIQHAHQKGIIHRDIKPSNVLVAEHDGMPLPKVIDFGIAKATTAQPLSDPTGFTVFEQFIGTPAYMSPEQAGMGGLDIDVRSDIYSLGVLLYELLVGQPPFDSADLRRSALDEVLRIIREREPPRPSARLTTLARPELTTLAERRQTEPAKLPNLLRGDLDWIVMKCLEKDRTHRYETANALAVDIQRHLNTEPVVARPPSKLYRFERLVRRNKLAFAAAGVVAAALVVGLSVSTWLFLKEKEARQEAVQAEQTAKMTLSTAEFSQAIRLIGQAGRSDALAHLAQSLAANPANEAALTRLTTLLSYHSWMLPTLMLKHSGPVASAQFSPDGSRILTASSDHTARVWNARTGEPLTGPLQHGDVVRAAQFSPDGKLLVTGSTDATARVWDAQTGQPLTGPLRHGAEVRYAEFSPDGKRIVTASTDHTARVWDAQSGQLLTGPLQHTADVRFAQFSRDGKLIVTASLDKTARVWDSRSGQPVTEPLRHGDWVWLADFSPDGKRVATASWDKTARIWDAQTGQPLTEPIIHAEPVLAVQFSPDGKWVATGSMDGTARVWDAQTGQLLAGPMRQYGQVTWVQFSPDGKRLLTASWDNTARVWDAQTGRPFTESLRHGSRVLSARFSRDGQRIVTASNDNTARLWEPLGGQALPETLTHGGSVESARFSPDGRWIVTASADNTARMWNAQTGQPLTGPMKHSDAVNSAEFSPDSKRIVTASSDSTAGVWDAASAQPLTGPLKHEAKVLSAHFSRDGRRIVTASADNTARVWDALTGQPVTVPLMHGDQVQSARFSPDGKRVVTACQDGTVRVWDAQTGQRLTAPLKQREGATSAEFSPDGRRIVTASRDGTVSVRDAQRCVPIMEPIRHSDRVVSAEFSPDGSRIATASMDYTAGVWQADNGQPLTEPLRHGSGVSSARFSPDGKRIVTACNNGMACVWDARTGQPLTELPRNGDRVLSAEFSPDGRRIVTASVDGKARVWDIAPAPGKWPDWLLPLTEAVCGQALNKQNVLEQTKLDRVQVLNQIRQELTEKQADDDWAIWGRWFLANPAKRTISPFSKITVPEYIEDRIKENTAESLAEAEHLASGNIALLERIAEARRAAEQTARRERGN
jgi:WD40 repeat protein/serine/threonine protein kinase